jgi:hypothetical protein
METNRIKAFPEGIEKQVTLVLAVWFAIAVFLSVSGATLALRPPFPQVVLCGLLGLLFAAFGCLKPFRSWLYVIPLYWLVAVHIARFVGAYFLILYHRNELPFAFAVPGGYGDIVVAAFATVLVILHWFSRDIPPALYWIWNTLGFIDILFVVATATRLALRDPNSMVALLRLPLSLLPTFLAPLIIFTHIIIAIRLFRPQRDVAM